MFTAAQYPTLIANVAPIAGARFVAPVTLAAARGLLVFPLPLTLHQWSTTMQSADSVTAGRPTTRHDVPTEVRVLTEDRGEVYVDVSAVVRVPEYREQVAPELLRELDACLALPGRYILFESPGGATDGPITIIAQVGARLRSVGVLAFDYEPLLAFDRWGDDFIFPDQFTPDGKCYAPIEHPSDHGDGRPILLPYQILMVTNNRTDALVLAKLRIAPEYRDKATYR